MENKEKQEHENNNKHKEYHYFVDGEKYNSEQSLITGAFIISLLPNFEIGYSLFEEKSGNSPDELIQETTTVSLDNGAKHFYTVPPATFGA
jgi:hypothetical protein